MKKTIKATGTAQQAASATLAQQAMTPAALPDPENANIVDRIKMNDAEARKRKGRASTATVGTVGKPMTTTKTLTTGMY